MRNMHNKYSQSGKDFEEGINFERLRRDRLQRVREAMKRHGLGAIVAFAEENIRYVTGIAGLPFIGSRYTVLPLEGEPMHFEQGGDLRWVRDFGAPWLSGRITHSIPVGDAMQFGSEAIAKLSKLWMGGVKRTLQDMGVSKEKIGFDYTGGLVPVLEEAGINYVNAWPCMYDARSIKTRDELLLLGIAQTIAAAGFYTMEQMMKPGIRESEVRAEMVKTMLSLGADDVVGTFCSGGRTNPYFRSGATDKILGPGDLVISDIVVRYMGYHTCTVRTMLVGDEPTSEQKALYRECYESMLRTMYACKAGVGTDKVAEALPHGTFEDYSLNIVHGLGIGGHEPPAITHMFAKDFPMELNENMYLAVETYAGGPDCNQGVRLEEDIVITESGYETLSRYPFDKRML
ncbi:MAG: Xaa-Pro peptidase family protein, partial [Thermodesulfobacteriota bacterium]